MYAEKYILDYVEKYSVSKNKIKEETGIDLDVVEKHHLELAAGDFLNLCLYLKLSPEDIKEDMFYSCEQ